MKVERRRRKGEGGKEKEERRRRKGEGGKEKFEERKRRIRWSSRGEG